MADTNIGNSFTFAPGGGMTFAPGFGPGSGMTFGGVTFVPGGMTFVQGSTATAGHTFTKNKFATFNYARSVGGLTQYTDSTGQKLIVNRLLTNHNSQLNQLGRLRGYDEYECVLEEHLEKLWPQIQCYTELMDGDNGSYIEGLVSYASADANGSFAQSVSSPVFNHYDTEGRFTHQTASWYYTGPACGFAPSSSVIYSYPYLDARPCSYSGSTANNPLWVDLHGVLFSTRTNGPVVNLNYTYHFTDDTTFTGSVNSISLTKTSTNSNYDVYKLEIPQQASTYTFLKANNNNKTVKKLEIYLSILTTD